MKKKFTAVILSLALVLTLAPVGVFAENGADGQADQIKVEAEEVGEASVKLTWVWNWDSEKLPEGFTDPADKAVFSILDADGALEEDLAVKSEENENGYELSDEGEYSFEVKGLDADTDYEFEVRAGDAEDKDAPSGKVKFKTEEAVVDETPASDEEPAGESPAARGAGDVVVDNAGPEDLAIALEQGKVTDSSIELKWTLTGYSGASDPSFKITKDGEPVEAEVTGTVDSGFSCVISGLTADTTYAFKVSLSDDETVSDSKEFATTKKKVSGFKGVATGDSKTYNYITLTWTPFEGAAEYVIDWSGDNYKEKFTVEAGDEAACTYKKKITTRGKNYTFRIKAVDADGNDLTALTTCKKMVPKFMVTESNITATTTNLRVIIPKGYQGVYKLVRVSNGKKKYIKTIKNDGSKQTINVKATKLSSASKYYFYLLAATPANAKGVISNKRLVRTAVSDVKEFRALSGAGYVLLKWKKTPRATDYVITRTGGGYAKKTWTTKKLSFKDNTNELAKDLNAKGFTYTIKARKKSFPASKNAASAAGDSIRTMLISITLGQSPYLYSHDGYNIGQQFYSGQTLTAHGFSGGQYLFYYNGYLYHVNKERVSSASVKQLNTGRTYTPEEATLYVNEMGLSSSTGHLIWVNTYTQKEYIFAGSQGKWTLVQGPWLVATGKPSTPTSTGMTRIKTRSAESGVPWWNITSWFSLHGNHPSWGNLGYPKSGACVRNTNDHAYWIYHNTALGTAVWVF